MSVVMLEKKHSVHKFFSLKKELKSMEDGLIKLLRNATWSSSFTFPVLPISTRAVFLAAMTCKQS